jgi:glutathione S-transferase
VPGPVVMASTTAIHVANNVLHEQPVPGGVRVGWQIAVVGDGMDIEVGVYFLAEDKSEAEVRGSERVAEQSGSFMTPSPGKLVFVLDNSYSMFNEKDVELTVMLPGAAADHQKASDDGASPSAAASAESPQPPPSGATSGYTLYYWAGFTGRAEAPILLLEDLGVKYMLDRDVKSFLYKGGNQSNPCFACPVLVDNGFALSQTTAIMEYLGRRHGRLPAEPREQASTLQLACTAADIWSEAYAARKSNDAATQTTFRSKRLAQWLAHLSTVLCHPPSPLYFGGAHPSYADFALLNAFRACEFMFGAGCASAYPAAVAEWLDRMLKRPAIAAFLSSERCEPVLYADVAAS